MNLLFQAHLARILPNYQKHKYVLAISGGLDSMVLVDLMLDLCSKEQLVVAHFNHRTRHEESDGDSFFVRQFAHSRKLVFEAEERKGQKLSEAALRLERYQFLERIKEKHQCNYVVLAHHLQDQIETFLMRILRGTGLDGLAVMAPKNGYWIRPLLIFSKETLEQEAQKKQIQYRVDSSNTDSKYFRNEIRLNLIPQLEKLSEKYGGKEKWLQRLAPLFEEIRGAKKELNRKTSKKLFAVSVQTPFWVRISREKMDLFSGAEKKRALRQILAALDIETFSSGELLRLETGLKTFRRNFSAKGLEVSESCGYLYFKNRIVSANTPYLEYRQTGTEVSCDLLGLALTVKGNFKDCEWRQVRPGDRFRGKKVKEYFLGKRIPRPERELIPVLAVKGSNELKWVYPDRHPQIEVKNIEFPFAVGVS
jgi:tRNA(Ile)-lysidine synthetase-like protein